MFVASLCELSRINKTDTQILIDTKNKRYSIDRCAVFASSNWQTPYGTIHRHRPLPSLRAYKVDVHSTQQEEIQEFAKAPEISNHYAKIEQEGCTH